ncbi:hypothetical protein F442_05354 [Phytophthora nicotianae P10297]|uniref:RxLR effector protein n=3 Tax=Phytophthora nicotianae TaxID=4792 RepID=W2PB71_PHYN3|nr:hypothetical protein PPTG_20412 [Phytophthora nicotianae INRA-310]ETM50911.1 hypothetical protein L914_05123 [Phytophthora nicotianae]ETM97244.1 hypothetical protein PPTG_20412 [Phytophthora nicotianae INRA-310]ETP49003.1 hypothetical protein F442_05354 [Phytophthora nicotianae P10297]KUF89652.1 hypothetical protein AM587_10001604 [Phytophthora nicotianae]
MRQRFCLVLLLFNFLECYIDLAHAKDTTKGVAEESNSSHPTFQDVNAPQSVRSSATVHADERSDDDEEDEARGLNPLKELFRWKNKNVATLQSSPALMKEVEHLKRNPVIMKNLKSVKENPTVLKRLETLQSNPRLVESLQNAPTRQSVRKVRSYLSKDQYISDGTQKFLGVLGAITVFFGPLVLISLLVQL